MVRSYILPKNKKDQKRSMVFNKLHAVSEAKKWRFYIYIYTLCSVTSVVSDSVRPHRRQPTRLPCPRDSPGKNTGVGCHFFLQCRKVKSKSKVAQSCPTLSDPMDCSLQAPPSMEFSRQEYWSGVPLPSYVRAMLC